MSAQPVHSTADTYPGPAGRSTPAPRKAVHCFSIHAAAEPGVMPRVLELFAKRNLVPSRWHSDVMGPSNRDLSIDLQVVGLDSLTADYVARCLRQVYGVETVLTSEKPVF
ncbi:hypothetical protein [Denitrobaculum tricleocarpae]|uniref:hypothetical protein n=1 Tax=Denitrobaculum tricleocarpae TaxID=2591009 RepID=UPI0015D11E4C|nr:hypothetical protein [Denitrobaculum tricleocarpae]